MHINLCKPYANKVVTFLMYVVLMYTGCIASESKQNGVITKKNNPSIQKTTAPFFRVDAENPRGPAFSMSIYENGKVEFGYLVQRDHPLEALDDSTGSSIKLRFKEKKQKARFDSLEFRELKATISNGRPFFKNSFPENGREGESGFVIGLKDEKNEVLSCTWVAPLSHEQAVFLKTIYDVSFKKFPNKTARLYYEGLKYFTPSLLK